MQDSEVRDLSALSCELHDLITVLCFSAVSVVHSFILFLLLVTHHPNRPFARRPEARCAFPSPPLSSPREPARP